MCVTCNRDNSHCFRYIVISPKPKSCAGHNPHTVTNNLIIFGRDEEEDQ